MSIENSLPFEQLSRKVLVKKESTTDPKYGKSPEKRTVKELLDSGVICVNKPSGPTSHQVADYVKRILAVESAGHGGTLDPGVTGALAVAVNKATRIMQTLLLAGKEYICLMHIHKPFEERIIRESLNDFIGKITQLPPLRSAVKRENRVREIYYLQVLEIDGQDVLFKVGCEAGTYIRRICDDFGKKLGCGAHMQQLVRTKAGPFTFEKSSSLQEIKDAFEYYKSGNEEPIKKILLPVEFGSSHLLKVWIFDNAVDTVCHGADLSTPGISKLNSEIEKGNLIAIMTLKNELIALGEAIMDSKQIMDQKKGIAFKIKKVFMEPGTYPKFKKVQAWVNLGKKYSPLFKSLRNSFGLPPSVKWPKLNLFLLAKSSNSSLVLKGTLTP